MEKKIAFIAVGVIILLTAVCCILGWNILTNFASQEPSNLLAGGNLDLVSYISDKTGKTEIHVVSLDHSFSKQLTDNDLKEEAIYWAPDAKHFLFTACQSSLCDIYIADADGQDMHALTHSDKDQASFTEPSWSPDGQWIAFVADFKSGKQIFVMDANGKKARRVTRDGLFNLSPRWSPDGETIVYSSNESGDYDIMTIGMNGKNKKQITNNDFDDTYPVWSPDSSKIAFLSMPDRSNGNLVYLVNPDGSNVVCVDPGIKNVYHDLAWSPSTDTSSIYFMMFAYSALPGDYGSSHMIYANWGHRGSGTQRSFGPGNSYLPSWSPDGLRMVYQYKFEDGSASEVFINLAGTMVDRLTYDNANVTYVAWVPNQPDTPTEFVSLEPTPEPSPTPITYFSEPFDNNLMDWSISEKDNDFLTAKREIIDGVYRWTITAKKGVFTSVENGGVLENFIVSVDARLVSGSSNSDYGLIFRSNGNDLYYFSIDEYDHKFSVEKNKNDEWISLVDRTVSDAIKQGIFNNLKIVANGNQYTFIVNGITLTTLTDDSLTGGLVGMAASLYEAGEQGVFEFDNFRVEEP